MNRKLICTLLLAAVAGACSSGGPASQSAGTDQSQDQAAEPGQRLATIDEAKLVETGRIAAPSNTEVVVTEDGLGNKVETRVFTSDPLVSSTVVKTYADGRKQVFVNGRDGHVVMIADSLSSAVLSYSAEDVARLAEIQAPPPAAESTPEVAQTSAVAPAPTQPAPMPAEMPNVNPEPIVPTVSKEPVKPTQVAQISSEGDRSERLRRELNGLNSKP